MDQLYLCDDCEGYEEYERRYIVHLHNALIDPRHNW